MAEYIVTPDFILPLAPLATVFAACAEITPPASFINSPIPAITRTPGPPLPTSDKPPVQVQATLSDSNGFLQISTTKIPVMTPLEFMVTNNGKLAHQFVNQEKTGHFEGGMFTALAVP